jgi:ADP-ribose pyrophosphatase
VSPHLTPIPKTINSEIVYHGFFDIRVDELQLPHGPKCLFTVMMSGSDAAAILAETSDGKLVINHEYRHATKQWLLSPPGGRIDAGENPLEAAKRELIEETGYASNELVLMGSVYPFPSVCDQKIYFILAKNAKFEQPATLETFELIHTVLKTKEELMSEISSGHPVDGVLCTALMLRNLFC